MSQPDRTCRFRITVVACLAALLVLAVAAEAQKKKKDSKDKEAANASLAPRGSDEELINAGIGEMLAAWQIGDLPLMQNYFSPDVTVISGVYEAPVHGWANFAAAYQRWRQRMQGVRLERENTYVNVKGNVAYAAYQWTFSAEMDGKPAGSRGHTTLILEKRGDRWLIVHNHTSVVEQAQIKPVEMPTPVKP
jgi:uncharacterized protein (TIGR02246 family)